MALIIFGNNSRFNLAPLYYSLKSIFLYNKLDNSQSQNNMST